MTLFKHWINERAVFANSKREWLFDAESVPFARNGWQPSNMFDPPELEQFLRDRHSNILPSPGLSATVTQFSELGDPVELIATYQGNKIGLHARYVIDSMAPRAPHENS